MRRVTIVISYLAGCGHDALVVDAARDGTGSDGPSDVAPQLRCVDLPATCGPTGTASCCGSPLVSGGTFFRSYDVGTDNAYTDMTNPATVSDFRFDTYEVTVGRFRQFVNAGMGTRQNPPPAGAGQRTLNGMANQGGWDPSWNPNLVVNTAALVAAVNCGQDQTWTDAPGANDSLPMNCMSWYEAMAFCAWDGGFLPTEAEWNYAATGGSEQRAFPWSSPASAVVIDCSYANYYTGTTTCVSPPNGAANRVGSESPKGDGRWGQADLAGNLHEWTLDWFGAYMNPCNDCSNLTTGVVRVIRGGDYSPDVSCVRTANRCSGGALDVRYTVIGVRCARAAP